MAQLSKTIILFKINKKSSRGFWFKESTVREYIDSEECKNRIENRTALGVLTHRVRKIEDRGVPAVDNLLLDRITTHTITRLFIEDGFLKAEILIFDPDLFEGETREAIKYLQGLLISGVKLTVSAGIIADYDSFTKEGRKIYDIVGVDFTLSPDFEDAQVIDKVK